MNRWRHRIVTAPAPVRWTLALLGIGAALNLVILGLNHYSHVPSGPPGSSFSTVPAGVAAYHDLLEQQGRDVTQITDNDRLGSLTANETLVVLDAAYLPKDQVVALRSFVKSGGRLVVGVSQPSPWLSRLFPNGPVWSARALGTVRVSSALPQSAGVHVVTTGGAGAWTDTGDAVAALGSQHGTLVAAATLGRGIIAFVSDPTFLTNALLAASDNASLALDLVGSGRAVAFFETIHGFGKATGYGAIPLQWKLALVTLAAAALFFLIARGRRLGAPEMQDDDSPPPRVAYVTSVAYTLARTKDAPGSLGPLGRELRSVVARKARLTDDSSTDSLEQAGRRFGLDEEESRVLRDGVRNLEDGLVAGKALARLDKGGS